AAKPGPGTQPAADLLGSLGLRLSRRLERDRRLHSRAAAQGRRGLRTEADPDGSRCRLLPPHAEMSLSLRARFALASGVLVVLVAAAVAAAGYLALRSSLLDDARAAATGQAAQLVHQIDTLSGNEGAGAADGNGGQGNYVDLRDPSLAGQ